MINLFPERKRKKQSWFYSAEAKKRRKKSLKPFDFKGGGLRWIFLHLSFYSKEKKMSLRFLILVAPHPGTLHPFISFLMDDESILCLGLTWSFLFHRLGWKRMGEGGLRNDMCHSLCFSKNVLSAHRPSANIPLTFSVATLYFSFLCFFPVLVWNSRRFETFNEKIIQLERKTELCSVV